MLVYHIDDFFICFAEEGHLSSQDGIEDDAHGPDVDALVIGSAPQDFWGLILPRRDRLYGFVNDTLVLEDLAKSAQNISVLSIIFLMHKYVIQLDLSMYDLILVQEIQSFVELL